MKIFTYESGGGRISDKYELSLADILKNANKHCSITVEPLRPNIAELIEGWDGNDSIEHILHRAFGDATKVRVLVSEADSNKFKNYCLKQAPHADWGCCLAGFIAVEYAPSSARLITQLHESLHLLGVDECYDEATFDPIAECSEPNCLMRYGVNSTTVCSHAISQIKS